VFLDPPDIGLSASPDFLAWWTDVVPDMFTHGPAGFADDRLADVNGWGSFDVAHIQCPVTVLHGSSDGLVPVAAAHHTAAIVPGATLRIVDGLGHMTILTRVVEITSELLATATLSR
jgi:pimeloyl-ACP methyl ester carboxylesterase